MQYIMYITLRLIIPRCENLSSPFLKNISQVYPKSNLCATQQVYSPLRLQDAHREPQRGLTEATLSFWYVGSRTYRWPSRGQKQGVFPGSAFLRGLYGVFQGYLFSQSSYQVYFSYLWHWWYIYVRGNPTGPCPPIPSHITLASLSPDTCKCIHHGTVQR